MSCSRRQAVFTRNVNYFRGIIRFVCGRTYIFEGHLTRENTIFKKILRKYLLYVKYIFLLIA